MMKTSHMKEKFSRRKFPLSKVRLMLKLTLNGRGREVSKKIWREVDLHLEEDEESDEKPVCASYHEMFLERLDRLKQCSKSVKEYRMELLNLMIKANKGSDALIRRFLDGLNKDVAYQIKLHNYATMEDLLNLAIKVEKQQQLLAAWLSSDSIFKSSSEEAKFEDRTKSNVADLKKHHKRKKSSSATFHSSSSLVMEEFVEYAVSGDVYVDDEPLVQHSSEGLDSFAVCIEDVNVEEKESQPIAYFREHLHRTCLKYSTYGKALYVLHLIVQGILNKRHAQSAELLESFPLIEQDSRTNLFEEGENDTCSGGHFRHIRYKGHNGNLVMFKDHNTRRLTLCRS
ncbi:hypothetical protein PIB30_030531 [Stylosanthes scabra]|uniref:Uncharacterized protein n=1 Tax=Stylosanthes scabra TaxID=79078 RepID=A0ABU6Z8K9_9FABA|nr:hypothetical protein [Stylosanthes scabra]